MQIHVNESLNSAVNIVLFQNWVIKIWDRDREERETDRDRDRKIERRKKKRRERKKERKRKKKVGRLGPYTVFFLHQWCKLLPYFWFKKVLRLTLLNDCHLSYQRIWHIGLDGLLCCVLLINVQAQQLSPSLSNSFSICWVCMCVS